MNNSEKITIQIQLRFCNCELEFVPHFGPGIVAIADVVIDPDMSIETCLANIKLQMLDDLFDLEYQIVSNSLDLQRIPTVIHIQ